MPCVSYIYQLVSFVGSREQYLGLIMFVQIDNMVTSKLFTVELTPVQKGGKHEDGIVVYL